MQKKRMVGLDFFRVIAAIIVFMFHTYKMFQCDYGMLNKIISMGAIFMTAFFMLSGFCLYSAHSHINLCIASNIKVFLIKRFINILPLFYLVTLLYHFRWGEGLSLQQKIMLFFVDISGMRSMFQYLPNTNFIWFVSCIIFCYVAYPFLQETIKQLASKTKVIGILICSLILFIAPFVQKQFQIYSFVYYSAFFRLLEFTLGLLLASLKEYAMNKIEALFTWKIFFIEFLLLCLGVYTGVTLSLGNEDWMMYNLIGIPLFALIIMTLSGVGSKKFENSKTLAYMCSSSYAFYLAQVWTYGIHKEIVSLGITLETNMQKLFFCWGTCLCITVLFHELFEKPLGNYLQKKLLHK